MQTTLPVAAPVYPYMNFVREKVERLAKMPLREFAKFVSNRNNRWWHEVAEGSVGSRDFCTSDMECQEDAELAMSLRIDRLDVWYGPNPTEEYRARVEYPHDSLVARFNARVEMTSRVLLDWAEERMRAYHRIREIEDSLRYSEKSEPCPIQRAERKAEMAFESMVSGVPIDWDAWNG